jgi:flavin reductase (DIM6/NTAB) family NADH-FMN oxidoreductase RutF
MKHTIGEVQKATSPNHFCLITTKNGSRTNIMALSWWTYVSNNPPMVAVALSKKGLSGGLIRESGEFGLCLADESIRDAAFRCGTCSGRNVDKAEMFGIELKKADIIGPMLIQNSPVSLECRMVNTVEASDHDLFLAEVIETHINPQYRALYALDGYSRLSAV